MKVLLFLRSIHPSIMYLQARQRHLGANHHGNGEGRHPGALIFIPHASQNPRGGDVSLPVQSQPTWRRFHLLQLLPSSSSSTNPSSSPNDDSFIRRNNSQNPPSLFHASILKRAPRKSFRRGWSHLKEGQSDFMPTNETRCLLRLEPMPEAHDRPLVTPPVGTARVRQHPR